jgi:hypothetical protein
VLSSAVAVQAAAHQYRGCTFEMLMLLAVKSGEGPLGLERAVDGHVGRRVCGAKLYATRVAPILHSHPDSTSVLPNRSS